MPQVRLDSHLQRREASHAAEFLALHHMPARVGAGAAAPREPIMTALDRQHYDALRQTARDLREFVAAIDRRMPRVEGPRERTIAVAASLLRHEALARISAIDEELKDALIEEPQN